MLDRIRTFVRNTLVVAYKKVRNFLRGCYRHAEAIAVLTFAAVGLNALLGELPFYYALPMWVEAPLIIPVVSVLVISLLMKSANHRALRRLAS